MKHDRIFYSTERDVKARCVLLSIGIVGTLLLSISACSGFACLNGVEEEVPLFVFSYNTGGAVGLGEGVFVYKEGRIKLLASNWRHYCSTMTPGEQKRLYDVLSDDVFSHEYSRMLATDHPIRHIEYFAFQSGDQERRKLLGDLPKQVMNVLEIVNEIFSDHFPQYSLVPQKLEPQE